MITCYLRYVIDPDKILDFEAYAQMWIPLIEKFGGKHHGYFLPHEGANNIAIALFSFPTLAAYEQYRIDSQQDPDRQQAYEFARQSKCIISYERSSMRPVILGQDSIQTKNAFYQGKWRFLPSDTKLDSATKA